MQAEDISGVLLPHDVKFGAYIKGVGIFFSFTSLYFCNKTSLASFNKRFGIF